LSDIDIHHGEYYVNRKKASMNNINENYALKGQKVNVLFGDSIVYLKLTDVIKSGLCLETNFLNDFEKNSVSLVKIAGKLRVKEFGKEREVAYFTFEDLAKNKILPTTEITSKNNISDFKYNINSPGEYLFYFQRSNKAIIVVIN